VNLVSEDRCGLERLCPVGTDEAHRIAFLSGKPNHGSYAGDVLVERGDAHVLAFDDDIDVDGG
jgi:hypothetical protein